MKSKNPVIIVALVLGFLLTAAGLAAAGHSVIGLTAGTSQKAPASFYHGMKKILPASFYHG